MDLHFCLKNNYLLRQAQGIFGNVVVNAFLTTSCYRDEEYYIESLKKDSMKIDNFDDYSVIQMPDGGQIVFQFLGNKFVEFSVSEWGHITDVTEEFPDYKQIR